MTLASPLPARTGEGMLLRPVVILAIWLALPLRSARPRVMQAFGRRVHPAGIAAVAAVLLVTMLLVDSWAITAARRLPPQLVSAFDTFTDFGRSAWILDPLGILLIALALLAAVGRTRTLQRMLTPLAMRLWFLFTAVAIPGLLADVLKLVGRARPFVTGKADPFVYSFPGLDYSYQSLPSGHATTAAAVAVAFGALWPRLRPLLWIYALLIATSRVVLTVHHPSDVIAGAMLGAVVSLLVRDWFMARGLVFMIDTAGIVQPRPVPSLRRLVRIGRHRGGPPSSSPPAVRR